MQIRPSSALRNEYTQISELAKASGKPIFIKNTSNIVWAETHCLQAVGGALFVKTHHPWFSIYFWIIAEETSPILQAKYPIGPEYPFLPIVFGQERTESLPKMMCRFLFQCLNNVTDGIRRVVSEKDMHVVFVGFHCHDFAVMSISDALNLLFYGINP